MRLPGIALAALTQVRIFRIPVINLEIVASGRGIWTGACNGSVGQAVALAEAGPNPVDFTRAADSAHQLPRAMPRRMESQMHIGGNISEPDPERAEDNPQLGLDAIRPPQFLTTQEEMDWRRDCQLAINRQPFEWAVAPRCEFRAPRSGVVLSAGAEIVPGRDVTVSQLYILKQRECILQGTVEGMRAAACPPDARFVVAPNQAISSKEGQLLAGAEVRAEWFDGGEQSLLSLLHRGIVRDRSRPPLSQAPEEVALRERELDLERAKADVQAATDALADRDDAKTQRAFLDARHQVDLAEVRLGHARKAIEAAKAAEAQRRRRELARQVQELDTEIKSRDGNTVKFRAAEIGAARALCDALRASHTHEDETYQLRIRRNAIEAELHGWKEVREETMPGVRFGQIASLAKLLDVDPRALGAK